VSDNVEKRFEPDIYIQNKRREIVLHMAAERIQLAK